jgi:hypothetical protein
MRIRFSPDKAFPSDTLQAARFPMILNEYSKSTLSQVIDFIRRIRVDGGVLALLQALLDGGPELRSSWAADPDRFQTFSRVAVMAQCSR